MAQGRPRDWRKEQLWRQRIQQWQGSGLTVRAFCAQHRLPEARFYVWRRRLHPRQQTSTPFVPVQLLTPRPEPGCTLEIVLDGGRSVRVRPGFDARTLQQVLAVLEEPASC